MPLPSSPASPRASPASSASASPAAANPLLTAFLASYRDLVRFLTRRTGSQDEASAIAHDTWIRLSELGQRGDLIAPTCPSESRAYIFTVARHLAVDRLRHLTIVQRHAEATGPATGPGNGRATGYAMSATPDESESLMYRQAIDAVQGALSGLPERARQVFLRNKVHGEDQSDLAAEFGVSRNLIERDMMLAMDRVEAAMHRWHGGRPLLAPTSTSARKPTSTLRSTSTATTTARRGRRQSLAALLGFGAVGIGGLGWWRWVIHATPQWQEAFATPHATSARHTLPDGSVLTLDAESRVSVAYYAGRRVVTLLAGAAFFDVKPEPARPFQVEVARATDGVRTIVLGTRFGVERDSADGVIVEVDTGRVAVEPTGNATWPRQTLTAGQRIRVRLPSSTDQARPGSSDAFERSTTPADAASWRHGVVGFSNEPLAAVIDRLRRYLIQPIDVDPAAATLRVSGQVRIDRIDDFLVALPRIVAVSATRLAGRWRIAQRGPR